MWISQVKKVDNLFNAYIHIQNNKENLNCWQNNEKFLLEVIRAEISMEKI